MVHNLGEIIPRDAAPDAIWLTEVASDDSARDIALGEFHATADAVARGLAARGLTRGQAVAILAGNSAEYLLAYFGIMRAGLVAVPINYKLPKATVDHIITDADVQLVLADGDWRHLVRERPIIEIHLAEEWLDLADPGPFTPLEMEVEEHATILYTSGSTGLPKGVPLTHGGYVWACELMRNSLPPMGGNRVLVAAPLYHMNGLILSAMTAMTGGAIVLLQQFSPIRYLETAAAHRCHVLTSVPTMIAMAVREAETIRRLDLSSVERVIMGSAPLSEALFDKAAEIFPGAAISNSWGTTESSPVAFGPHPDGLAIPKLSIGYPGDHTELELRDGPDGNQGVLWVRNKAVMPGYLNRPEETDKCLHDGWYDTGDIMRRDGGGFFFFVGRADDMFVCGGENVYPAEVERLLEQHADVAQAAVIAFPDDIKQHIPVAFVVAKPSSTADVTDIKQFTLANGPAYRHPRFIGLLEELPLAGTNKIDRRALFERARSEFSR
ncbi:MAG: class I adenylate-forming enzyme family protein [Alphaproteobacteria bacterium]